MEALRVLREEAESEEIIAGRRPSIEALRGGRDVVRVCIAAGVERRGVIEEITRLAYERRVPVEEIPRGRIAALAGDVEHQGVLTFVTPFVYSDLADVIEAGSTPGRLPVIAVLDEVSDPRNLGAILRSADGAGIAGIVLPRRRSAPVNMAAIKTAAGAQEHVKVARVSNIAASLEELKKEGYWVIGTSAPSLKIQTFWGFDLSGKIAFVLGSEGGGIRSLVAKQCDAFVSIPMAGAVESLNVSIAAALLFYEARRRASATVGATGRG